MPCHIDHNYPVIQQATRDTQVRCEAISVRYAERNGFTRAFEEKWLVHEKGL